METADQWRGNRPALWDLFRRIESGIQDRRVVPGLYGIRIEERFRGDAYVVSAELPGIDPDRDLEVSIADGRLILLAERRGDGEDSRYSEFRYGAFGRALRLPSEARCEEASARYQDGVVTITVPCRAPAASGRRNPAADG